MIIWMVTTNDKYELPIAVADTANELARIIGNSPKTIYGSICRNKKGRINKSIYKKVEIDNDDEGES